MFHEERRLDETISEVNKAAMQVAPVRSSLLDQAIASGIRHGFFTRAGGVSKGVYRGLNTGLGSNDDPEMVRENRRRVAEWMGIAPQALLSAFQIHSSDVAIIRESFAQERPEVDAMVTDRPGLAICVSTADCGPVLFADPQARIVGAAHAGWKGAFTGILENTISAMESLGGRRDRIIAVLGPSIRQKNYEVGPEFMARFLEADEASSNCFIPSDVQQGHALFDLARYTTDRLNKAGVQVETVDLCTYAEEQLFYSYRRTTHRNEADYGRQISAIVLEN